MKYLILISSNPRSRALWETLSDEQRLAFGRDHIAFGEGLVESGELVVSQALADPSTAKRVSVADGRTVTSDGPFAEAKEYLAGFYVVECDSIERAVEVAATVPDVRHGGEVEVRPALDLSFLES